MSIPLHCRTCGEVVGTSGGLALVAFGPSDTKVDLTCNGKHKKGTLTVKKQFRIGSARYSFERYYPETQTRSSWVDSRKEVPDYMKGYVSQLKGYSPRTFDLDAEQN